jgi:arylsulfatase A-like enzyme
MILRPACYLLLVVSMAMASCTGKQASRSDDRKPNIIYILADDLGYGELGCYGQELIETPNIDLLAQEGMLFTDHYSGAPVCAPSRCVLLSGMHSGHAYIRGNDEWKERGDTWNYRAMSADSTLEGQRPMPVETQTIGKLLQGAGYATGMIGKWGLGAPHTQSIPTTQGFEFFCGYNCQRQAHTYFPLHLYKNERRLHLENDTVAPHTKLQEGADPYEQDSYAPFTLKDYAPDLMFDEMMQFIEEHKNRPFFLYWASPIPHVPIQAPRRWIDYYVKKFGDEAPYLADRGYFPHRYPRAGYAAMVSYLDERVGLLVAHLKAAGIYENTLIIFSSDNGPSYAGGADSPWFNSAGEFSSEYGRGKGFLHEGGIRVPMIASWPKRVKAGSQSDHISAFWDVLPTLCDVAGVATPPHVDGISFLPELLGQEKQEEHEYLYWEFPSYGGQQALRMGDWKGIRKNILEGNMDIELYKLVVDMQEQHDLAEQHPELVAHMDSLMKEAHVPAELDRFKIPQLGD